MTPRKASTAAPVEPSPPWTIFVYYLDLGEGARALTEDTRRIWQRGAKNSQEAKLEALNVRDTGLWFKDNSGALKFVPPHRILQIQVWQTGEEDV